MKVREGTEGSAKRAAPAVPKRKMLMPDRTAFLVLYRGKEIADARVVAISADPRLVHDFALRMLEEDRPHPDPVLGAVDEGRREALKLVRDETREEENGR